jgi:hypothetical protein
MSFDYFEGGAYHIPPNTISPPLYDRFLDDDELLSDKEIDEVKIDAKNKGHFRTTFDPSQPHIGPIEVDEKEQNYHGHFSNQHEPEEEVVGKR